MLNIGMVPFPQLDLRPLFGAEPVAERSVTNARSAHRAARQAIAERAAARLRA
jgi:hypothetical protein